MNLIFTPLRRLSCPNLDIQGKFFKDFNGTLYGVTTIAGSVGKFGSYRPA